MNVVSIDNLADADRELLEIAADHIPWALNKKSNPRICAIALGEKGYYRGNNIFLSNCTLACAEANAIAAAVAAGDQKIAKLYMAVGRSDVVDAPIVSPCGNCRQFLHDFARLAGKPIEVYATNNLAKDALVTSSEELLPEAFSSVSLGAMHQG